MLNACAVMGTAVIAVPLILERVGSAGYGAWTLAGAVIVYASILETAVGPSLQREVSISAGAGEAGQIHRTFWTLLVVYSVIGALSVAVLRLLGPHLADVLELEPTLANEARVTYEQLGTPLALVLLGSGLGNYLQGLGRFDPVAISTGLGGIVYLVAIPVLVGSGELSDLVWAATLQQGTICLVRGACLHSVWLAGGRPRLLAGRDVKRLTGFSARLQPTAISELFNWQSDKVVVGVVAPAGTLANVGIGMQLSDAGRIVSASALNPIIATFARLAGAGEVGPLRQAFQRMHRLWTVSIFGGAVILAATAYPLVIGWVGPAHDGAAIFAAVLIGGSACWLSAGIGVAYLRAIGQVGLEARYASVILGLNVVLTVALALLVGPYGVVAGTLAAYAAGAAYFFRRLSRRIAVNPVRSTREAVRILVAAGGCALFSFGVGFASVAALPQGIALVPVGAGILIAGVVYVRLALGLLPSRERLRVALRS